MPQRFNEVKSPSAISFRESLFSPAEVAICTGLSAGMQRVWRKEGHLPARTTGISHFSPREMAEIAVMVALRGLGLGPSVSRSVAAQAAPSVLWLALADHPETWRVAGEPQIAERLRRDLELSGDSHLRSMAGLQTHAYIYGVAEAGGVELVSSLEDFVFDDESEDAQEIDAILKLRVVARKIARGAKQPLVTVLAPSSWP